MSRITERLSALSSKVDKKTERKGYCCSFVLHERKLYLSQGVIITTPLIQEGLSVFSTLGIWREKMTEKRLSKEYSLER